MSFLTSSPDAEPTTDLSIYRTRSELTEALLHIDGKRVSLEHYPMFRAIYDGGFKNTILMTCRQVGKSTTLSNFAITESLAVPHFRTFFVAPSQEQTLKFSTLRVGKTIHYSPMVRKHFVDAANANRVLSRMFANGAEINFSYASDDADRARGVSADRLDLDEIQDMSLDVVIPVVKECLANSEYKYLMYCGTPKTMENGIQNLWQNSTQTEWVMQCGGCKKYNAIRSEKSLGKHGPICLKCGHYLNPRFGQWVDMNPGAKLKGFHVSRPIMPKDTPSAWAEADRIEKAQANWNEILEKMEGPQAYPISQFRNEVLGVSDSQGRRLVTIEMLREAATGPAIAQKPGKNLAGVTKVAAGIDWSGGGSEIKSRTVLVVLGWVPATGRQRVLYYKIFPGVNPVDEVNEIIMTLSMYSMCSLVGCDAGVGNMQADMLRKKLANRHILKYMYSGNSGQYITWNEKGRFHSINKTRAIDSVMMTLNRREIEFPTDLAHGAEIHPVFQDILNEYEEETREGRKVWRHSPENPDDSLHALTFARVSLQGSLGELNLTAT